MANFKDYASTLNGMKEVEVTGTSMTDISVGLPTVDVVVDSDADADADPDTTGDD
jgi:hypothetical protein